MRIREKGKRDPGKRSVCLKCGRVLRWYELVPVISWVFLRGKCRGCGKFIGFGEILAEVSLGLLFVISYLFWPEGFGGTAGIFDLGNLWGLAGFLAFLALSVGMLILLAYDFQWGRLPVSILTFVNICAIMVVGSAWLGGFLTDFSWGSFIGGITILAGVYYGLYKISKEQWVGGGDWILGLGIAICLMDWRLAFLVLFLSNILGCFYILGFKALGKLKGKQIAFGPFLIVAFWIVFLLQDLILTYFRI